jgi:hypothetical protein
MSKDQEADRIIKRHVVGRWGAVSYLCLCLTSRL